MTRSSGKDRQGAGAPGPELDALIDAYIDGAMSDAERAAFETRATTDRTLARELALQRAADDSLRRQFSPPAAPTRLPGRTDAVAGRVDQAGADTAGRGASGGGAGDGAGRARRRMISPPLAAAALILLALAVGYFAMNGSPFGGPSRASAADVYKQVVDGGFKPQWVCDGPEQFSQYTKERFGAPWHVDQEKGVTLVGWRYSADLLSPDENLLLATKDGQKIVVVADVAANARRLRDADGLKVHERETRGLVMYEISPLDLPVIINHITVDENP